MRDIRRYQRAMKSMCRVFYKRPRTVEFIDGVKKEISITHGDGHCAFTAYTWKDLHDYLRKLTNPASRI